jgi:hypothetical protein
VVKIATNRLTEQMADDLRPHMVSRRSRSHRAFMRLERMKLSPERAAETESAEFPGRAVAALVADPNVLERSGGVFTTPELAREYGFTDVDGSQMSGLWRDYLGGT